MSFLDDENLMFNIALTKKPIPKIDIKFKADKKRQKYSRKLKQQRRRTPSANPKQKTQPTHVKSKLNTLDSELSVIANSQIVPTQVKPHKQKTIEKDLDKMRQISRKENKNTKERGDQTMQGRGRDKKSRQNHLSRSRWRQDNTIGEISVPKSIKVPQELSAIKNPKQRDIDITPLDQFSLDPSLSNSLTRNGITKLTDIQKMSYHSLYHLHDTIIKANTGSGKTLAYLVPLINQMIISKKVDKRKTGTVVLVICPNRQLCIQGEKQALRCVKRAPFIVPGCLMGGEQINHQKNRIRKGVTILFATPGRLAYHLKNTKAFKLDNLKTIIFEEADRTLDMGFQPTIKQILDDICTRMSLAHLHKVLVSAHFNEKVKSLIQNLQMNDPKYIGFTDTKAQEDHDGKEINISDKISQKYVLISEEQRLPLLIAYLSLLRNQKILIFVSTIDQVVYLDMLLNNLMYRNANGQKTEEKVEKRSIYKLHGDLDQKLRSTTYFNFRKQKQAILISTEVASRGLDFPDLSHIILFDPPPTITDYGNRVGRSGRFNNIGNALMILHYQESDLAEKIRFYNSKIENLNRDVIFNGFEAMLKSMNIGEGTQYYLEGLIRGLVKDDQQKYQVARRAYTSMLRAYARLPDKDIFVVKKLNLKLVARTFGLNSSKKPKKDSKGKSLESRQTNFNTIRKKRKVQNVQKLQFSQYM